mmetsp:Transcript_31068/g.58263  ORF Transcript_31068/g.58263 Transcript_31068/m.58263 type:complete len:112 (-) Transcript_31068:65-400(-)
MWRKQYSAFFVLLLLALFVPGAEAAITCVKVKRWIEYVAICCCTCASTLCLILLLFFLTNKAGGDGASPWEGWEEPNETNATDVPAGAVRRLLTVIPPELRSSLLAYVGPM